MRNIFLLNWQKKLTIRTGKSGSTRLRTGKNVIPLRYDTKSPNIKPQYVIEQIWEATKERAIIVTGVGQHQMWTAQFYKHTKPRHFITSGGLGTMGFGLPAAIGAQIARPDALVIDIDGDSSFNMTLTEISTAVQYELPIKVCIINNGYMGMVRQWQELFYNKRYSKSLSEESGICGGCAGARRGRNHS